MDTRNIYIHILNEMNERACLIGYKWFTKHHPLAVLDFVFEVIELNSRKYGGNSFFIQPI